MWFPYEIMQKIWSETLKRNIFLKKGSKTFEAKQSEMKRNFFPEFCEKEVKPSETVCVSLSLALKWNFFRSKIGTP